MLTNDCVTTMVVVFFGQVSLVASGAAQLTATRAIVHALRTKDVTDNIVVHRSHGHGIDMNLRLKVGQTDYESVRDQLGNATTVALKVPAILILKFDITDIT